MNGHEERAERGGEGWGTESVENSHVAVNFEPRSLYLFYTARTPLLPLSLQLLCRSIVSLVLGILPTPRVLCTRSFGPSHLPFPPLLLPALLLLPFPFFLSFPFIFVSPRRVCLLVI